MNAERIAKITTKLISKIIISISLFPLMLFVLIFIWPALVVVWAFHHSGIDEPFIYMLPAVFIALVWVAFFTTMLNKLPMFGGG